MRRWIPVEKKRKPKRKFDDTKVLLSPFLFGFCTISGSCKEVYSRSYLRFISFNFASGSMELTVSRLMAKKG